MDIWGIMLILLGLTWVITFLIGIYQTFAAPKSPAEARLEAIARRTTVIEREFLIEERGEPWAEAQRPRQAQLLPTFARLLSNIKPFERLERELKRARSNWRAAELVYASLVLMSITIIIINLILARLSTPDRPIPMSWRVALSLAVGGFTLTLPFIYLRLLQARWQRQFERHLPNTLMLMANGLRAGMGFLQTVEMVAQQGMPPISDEFQRLHQELEMGIPLERALNDFADRVGTLEAELLATSVLIQRETGGGLADIIDIIANTIRERLRVKGEIRIITTQGRFTAFGLALLPVIFGLIANGLPSFLVPGAEPWLMPLFTTTAGRWMLFIGFVMQVIGFIWVRRIVTIEA
ncbi:MAG: type II secretion system F family protein [Armatimonadota bacterium]|nr:type II secretion system F family protein [Armatimonadota bacterium]MCX7777819.1 type II secretion system F family protein [Armatimonadota bacterium]MDW8025933.1 type II secretion system F family protein [Armatimonadota bacterium]